MLRRLLARLQPEARRLLASPLAQRLTTGLFWSILGGLLGRGAILLAGIVVARILGKQEYGALGMIQSTILMFGIFAGFGMGMTATKYVAEFRVKDPRRAGQILALTMVVAVITGCVSAAALYAAGPWLAEHTLAAPNLAGALQVSALVFLFTALNGAQTGALSGLEAFRTAARVNLWTGLLSLVINAGFVLAGGFTGAVWGLVASSFMTCVVTSFAIRVEARRVGIPISFDARAGEWWVLVRYSLPASLSQIVVGPVRWVCGVMLVNAPNGYAEMGLFNAANQWSQVFVFLSAMVANVSIPILSERLGDGDRHSSVRVLKGSVLATAAIVLPLVAGGSLLSPWIMGAYGSGFRQGWPTLVVSFVTAALLAVEAPVGTVIQASGRMWVGALMNFGWGAAHVLFTLIALPLGALGLALAMLGAYVVHGVWTLAYAQRILRVHDPLATPFARAAP